MSLAPPNVGKWTLPQLRRYAEELLGRPLMLDTMIFDYLVVMYSFDEAVMIEAMQGSP